MSDTKSQSNKSCYSVFDQVFGNPETLAAIVTQLPDPEVASLVSRKFHRAFSDALRKRGTRGKIYTRVTDFELNDEQIRQHGLSGPRQHGLSVDDYTQQLRAKIRSVCASVYYT